MDRSRQPSSCRTMYGLWKLTSRDDKESEKDSEQRESEVPHRRERAGTSEDCSPELGSVTDGQALIPTGVTLHTNELFTDRQAIISVDQDGPPIATSTCSPTLIQVQLKFEDIHYKVTLGPRSTPRSIVMKRRHSQHHETEKVILNGVSGSVSPGEILALMGPSGSGKTSLLSILGGRCHGKVAGRITYNGAAYTSALKSRIGFVTQDDILFPVLTVRETLVFAALLRLKMSHREKIRRAETVLRELGLERCQNTIVGGPFVRGVSGGERKRTSIGYEILVDPSLLLLDEPTSGLDSSTALKILQVLRANAQGRFYLWILADGLVARNYVRRRQKMNSAPGHMDPGQRLHGTLLPSPIQVGRLIVTTIHQPSSRMFPMFDKLILLSAGQPLYFGPARHAMDYFASQHFTPLLPMNPADFLLDLATGITSDMTVPPELKTMDPHTGNSTMTEANTEQEIVKAATCSLESHVGTHPSRASYSSQDENQRQSVLKLLRSKYRSELETSVREKLQTDNVAPTELKAAILVKKSRTSSWLEQFFILSRRTCKARRKDYFNVLRFAQGVAVALLLGMLWWRSHLDTEQNIRDQVGLLFYICIFWCTFSMWSTMMVFPLEKNYLAKERAADMYPLSAYFISSTICDLIAELVHPTIFVPLVYFMTGLEGTVSTFIFTLLSVYLIAVAAQAFGEFFGALTLNFKTVGIVSAMIMLIFLLAGGYYVKNIPVFMKWIRYVSLVYYGFRLLKKVQYSPDQTYNCSYKDGCLRFEDSPVFDDTSLDGGLRDAMALVIMIIAYKLLAYFCLRRV